MASTPPQVWLITGCSTGLGASLAIHALKAGHAVIATARNPSSAPSYTQISSLGGKWLPLDVTSPTAGDVVQEAVKLAGRIDVLVNNAGYSILGAMEDISFVPSPPLSSYGACTCSAVSGFVGDLGMRMTYFT